MDITMKVNGKEFALTLIDVLYIPLNPQNLVSLGQWDKAGGSYHGGQGTLTMITASGTTIARGTQISNHLYKLNEFTIPKFTATVPTHPTNIHHII